MYGIKAEGQAMAGVVLASANQIHDCGRANEPVIPGGGELGGREGGGILGVAIATGLRMTFIR